MLLHVLLQCMIKQGNRKLEKKSEDNKKKMKKREKRMRKELKRKQIYYQINMFLQEIYQSELCNTQHFE